ASLLLKFSEASLICAAFFFSSVWVISMGSCLPNASFTFFFMLPKSIFIALFLLYLNSLLSAEYYHDHPYYKTDQHCRNNSHQRRQKYINKKLQKRSQKAAAVFRRF